MKIDLHVHCMEYSACAHASMDEQIAAAIDYGLDALVFTNHQRFVPQARLAELNMTYGPFRVYGGVEITVDEREDILVLGVHDAALETVAWTYPDLHAFVRARGGWLAVAHPFRYRPAINLDLDRYPPDALEVCSTNISPLAQPRIRDIAAGLGIPVVGNSDAHITQSIGVAFNRLKGDPVDDRGLVDALRNGDFLCVCGQRA